MMKRFDRYVSAVWKYYGLWGILLIVAVVAFLCWFFGVDVGGMINALRVNWNS